ncbi:1-acyl-sn-glycerol-3-phosphate acyltransferase [Dissulfurirhabdus thermomarina]|uniref:1-acyl-sn-glycerol-3-phosphate acyltransferase n=1 Tax=Dissulfurirhabdus thermomarina TaxID=1765737 RepID=A0A6N9TML6_DISTH|nr:lysophospholipid acyltransferase family protein [Dissulfurirhabdus thermomarina]NDY41680.1 1-acyl-sn-glycerol-3-phosphate acyltransferase [Dissulfurirhabdus thermomarina]NMX22752.1 1-acyl-sn-glycerol-3-phosphate acyltransferase [Dissulfurirhabdus thermomarina]
MWQRIRHITRGLLFIPWFLSLTAVLAPVAIAMSLVTRSGDAAHRLGRRWSRWLLAAAGVEVEVTGREHLAGLPGGLVIAANHASQLDILALFVALPIQFRFVAKKELFHLPLLGPAMRFTGYIPIDRSGGRSAVESLNRAAEVVRSGVAVLIFPEGTRSPDGRLRPFKPGGVLLARKAGTPVLPVAISGSHRCLPRGSILVRPGRIRVRLLPPVDPVGPGGPKGKDALTRELHQAILSGLDPGNRPA